MDHPTFRAPLHHHFARHIIRRPNMVDKQESLVRWLLARYTPDYAFRIDTEVG